MGSEWPISSLESLAAPKKGAIAIGPFGSRMKADCYVETGVAVIRGTNLGQGKSLSGEFVFITPEKAAELGNANLKPGDLVFPHRGAIGEVGIVPNDGCRYALSTSLMKITLNLNQAIPDFYYYFFKSARGRSELLKNASQVGTPGIATPLTSLKACEVPCPSLVEQKRVVDVLSLIDNRIDLLRQTNTTLEAIAQALFKSWFVDFDPVHAKAEGREPEAMDAATAALFPSEFEESELGLIPKGWRVHSLDAIADYVNGLALQKFPAESETEFLPVIKIAQLRAGHTTGGSRASAHLKPEYVVHDGDVLFSWSGSLEVELWCGGDGALNQHLFKVTSDKVPKWFYYSATRLHLPNFRNIAASKATTMGHIQRKHLTQAKMAVPPPDILIAATTLMSPLLERRIMNSLQMRELADLRDTLLPRLISGKLRLPEAMEATQEALA